MTNKQLVVASQNPIKIEAALQSCQQVFSEQSFVVQSVNAPSQVAEQPMSCDETLRGAINRVQYCQQHYTADLYIAYEGGVDMIDGIASTYAVVCVADGQRLQTGRTATLPLPLEIYQRLQQGAELGPEMDAMFATQNIKQRGGAIGQLTQGLETRLSTYTAATILTLTPFVHPQWY